MLFQIRFPDGAFAGRRKTVFLRDVFGTARRDGRFQCIRRFSRSACMGKIRENGPEGALLAEYGISADAFARKISGMLTGVYNREGTKSF